MGIISSGIDFFASRAANKARGEAAEKNQEAEDRKLTAARQAPLGVNATLGTTTTAREGGGFDINFTPGSSQETAAGGNLQRQIAANELTGTTTAPSQGTIDTALGERDQLNFGRFSKGLSDLVSQRQRTSGGIQLPGSQFEGATVDAIGRFADANRANTPVEALTLRSQLDREAAALQGQQLQNLGDRGVTPVAGPGNNIAQIIGAQNLTPTPTDLSGANPFMAAGGFMDDLARQEAEEDANQRYNDFLEVLRNRQQGNTGSGTFELPSRRGEELA